jgi:hypothetical protein
VIDPKFAGLYNDTDPLVGNSDGSAQHTIQRYPVRKELRNIPRFVTVKAGGYFFMPGIKALQLIAGAAVIQSIAATAVQTAQDAVKALESDTAASESAPTQTE